MGDARSKLLGLQRRMLASLASADSADVFRAQLRTPLRDDLLGYLRGKHLSNVRIALAQLFPITSDVLCLSDAQLRRHFPSLASLARSETRLDALFAGLREAIAEHEHPAVLGDLLGFEHAVAAAKLRGPSSLEQILEALELVPGAALGDADRVELGAVSLQRTISNAPELFFRHDPRQARPLGWQRWIAHVFREGWTRPKWFEFDDLRALRIRVLVAA